MPKVITVEDFKNSPTPHSKLLYQTAKKNNMNLYELAQVLQCSYGFVVLVLRGKNNLSVNKANFLRNNYEQ